MRDDSPNDSIVTKKREKEEEEVFVPGGRRGRFGSPTNRKDHLRQGSTFNAEMSTHGLIKDIDVLNSFNAFFEKP